MTDERTAFEAVISGPPYELEVARYPDAITTAWPGNYKDYRVDLSWAIWQEARAAQPAVALPELPPLPDEQTAFAQAAAKVMDELDDEELRAFAMGWQANRAYGLECARSREGEAA